MSECICGEQMELCNEPLSKIIRGRVITLNDITYERCLSCGEVEFTLGENVGVRLAEAYKLDVQDRLTDINEKIDLKIDYFWEQARKNVEEDKEKWIKRNKDKLDEISKDVEVLTGVDGMIELDPNNWSHVYWWQEDGDVEEFMDNNREKIEQYAKLENVSISESVDILFEQSEIEEHDPRESLKQSLIEMKLIREGKMKAIPWDEIYNKLKNEKEDEK